MNKIKYIAIIAMCFILSGCYPDETLNVPVKENDIDLNELDQYIQTNFVDKYGITIRYKASELKLDPGRVATSPKLEVVRPMLDFIQKFWIDPYMEVENGQKFFEEQSPSEVYFLGGLLYNSNGTVTLGTADAGVRITFTNVNAIDPDSVEWRALQLQTVYHEFAHTVHQDFKLPPSFETISPSGYTSAGAWFVLSDDEALERGFVTPYATSSPNEDFAELVALYLYEEDFFERFTVDEADCNDPDCETRNMGREMIRQKLAQITDHYEKVTSIKLEDLRASVQAKLN